jgi:hypothetical protein
MQSQLKKYLTAKNIVIAGFVIVIIIIVILSILAEPKEEQAPSAQAPLAIGECRPVPGKGKQTYNIMTDNHKDLEIVKVDVDPIDVKEGETQKITVKVQDKNKNTKTAEPTVSANISTDSKYTAASAFTLQKQKNSRNGSITIWEGLWTRDDDYCKNYVESIIATNGKGDEAKVDLSFK